MELAAEFKTDKAQYQNPELNSEWIKNLNSETEHRMELKWDKTNMEGENEQTVGN